MDDFQRISRNRKVWVAVPVMQEMEWLPRLMESLTSQRYRDFGAVFCVNQPDGWWDNPLKKTVCRDNEAAVDYLRQDFGFPVVVIDRTSRGLGWKGTQGGVGWARKLALDEASAKAGTHDILVSTDADTTFPKDYLESVVNSISAHPGCTGLSVPYYHRMTGDEITDRQILRYEIYMRSYAVNLWRTGNPYHFTAVGSSMAFTSGTYRDVGGITPKASGEDFYFMMKLSKRGRVLNWNPVRVFPAARFSSRVIFGTGPAMIMGRNGDWSRYPVYPVRFFDEVEQTFRCFEPLFHERTDTPMDAFLSDKFGDPDHWETLRRNAKDARHFVIACIQRVDALRILQFLRYRQQQDSITDERNLAELLTLHYPAKLEEIKMDMQEFSLDRSDTGKLNAMRDLLFSIEEGYQIKEYREWN
ncbi:MAG: glycosyltransferase [Bacteroidales bacterium]|nr:glycosyltransferase [Bacteroidales bacterium]